MDEREGDKKGVGIKGEGRKGGETKGRGEGGWRERGEGRGRNDEGDEQ